MHLELYHYIHLIFYLREKISPFQRFWFNAFAYFLSLYFFVYLIFIVFMVRISIAFVRMISLNNVFKTLVKCFNDDLDFCVISLRLFKYFSDL